MNWIFVVALALAAVRADDFHFEEFNTGQFNFENPSFDVQADQGISRQLYPGFPIHPGISGVRPPVPSLPPSKGSRCITSSKQAGTCTVAQECYPFIYSANDDKAESNELVKIYTQNIGFCSPKHFIGFNHQLFKAELYVDLLASLICCPTEKPPTMAPVQAPNNTGIRESTDCGTRKNIQSDRGHCTKLNLDPKVPGGMVSEHGQFPFAVALMVGSQQFCGGSIISDRHILTAAHCIEPIRNKIQSVKIIAGDNDIYLKEQHEIHLTIAKTFMHEGYSSKSLVNDIAIIKTNEKIPFNGDFAKPICKATTSINPMQSIVAGWGKIYHEGPPSRKLRFAQIKVWKNEDCSKVYRKHPQAPAIQSSMICAGSDGKDSCQGDSGGPLMHRDCSTNKFTQIGIVSFGIGCGQYPGVYTRVEYYAQWIEQKMKM